MFTQFTASGAAVTVMVLRVWTALSRRLTVAGPKRRAANAVLVAVVAVAVCGMLVGSGVARAAANPGSAARVRTHWGKVEPVPGLASLNKGSNASVNSQANSARRAG
jgi:heme A synthase